MKNLTDYSTYHLFRNHPISIEKWNRISRGIDRTRTRGTFIIINRIMWIHGSPDGYFSCKQDPLLYTKDVDYISVCRPGLIRIRYPEIAHKIIGNWSGITWNGFNKIGDTQNGLIEITPYKYDTRSKRYSLGNDEFVENLDNIACILS